MDSDIAKPELAPIAEGDLSQLAELYQQLLPNESSLSKMQKALSNNLGNPKHLVLAAKIDGRLVGSLLAVTCEMFFGQCKSFLVVEDVVVDSTYRRQGIGKALMQYVEQHARENNCSYIMLVTDAKRVDAQEFYKSLGYQSEKYCAFQKRLQDS